MELITIIIILGLFYWASRAAYILYKIITGFIIASCAGIFAMVRHIYNSKRYKGSGKT